MITVKKKIHLFHVHLFYHKARKNCAQTAPKLQKVILFRDNCAHLPQNAKIPESLTNKGFRGL